jgi:hypothetical protein
MKTQTTHPLAPLPTPTPFLDAVTKEVLAVGVPQPPPSDDARLKAAMVIQTYTFLGQALQTAATAYGNILDTTPQQLDSVLGDLIAAAEGIQTKAKRLLASNR